jgi:hypothetical protein
VTTDGFGKVHRAIDADSRVGLSRWKAEGFTLPENIIDFREQDFGDKVVTVVQWRAEKKVKAPDEVGAT